MLLEKPDRKIKGIRNSIGIYIKSHKKVKMIGDLTFNISDFRIIRIKNKKWGQNAPFSYFIRKYVLCALVKPMSGQLLHWDFKVILYIILKMHKNIFPDTLVAYDI